MNAGRGTARFLPSSFMQVALVVYLVIFFGYLLGPLLIMGVTAFNSPGFPRAAPFECFTFEWFDTLYNDQRIVKSLQNSAIVGAGTVVLSLLLGLAGALVLTQIWPKLRATYYTVVIAPILIPGVVLGISTLVFWGRINTMLGLPDDGFLRNGIFLTVLGQTTFIASYCMLVFIARLQRFDQGQMEAALDLGATHPQAFRKILLPFLKPAFGSAAVIAFLASFENYNTTTFTFGTYPTLTIELAQKVRYGINPSISALAVIIVGITIVGALLHEAYKRREALALANGAPIGAVSSGPKLPGVFSNNPAAIVLVLVGLSFVGTLWFSQVHDPSACKLEVREIKRQEAEQRRQEMLQRREEQRRQQQMRGPDIFAPAPTEPTTPTTPAPAPTNPGQGSFGDVFNPGNLGSPTGESEGDAPSEDTPGPDGQGSTGNPGRGTFGDVFDPTNLGGDAPGGDLPETDDAPSENSPGSESQAPTGNPGRGTFGDVFDPSNLGGDGSSN
ncbi:MAG: ABC transporter permease [Pseudomonadota bacterium]